MIPSLRRVTLEYTLTDANEEKRVLLSEEIEADEEDCYLNAEDGLSRVMVLYEEGELVGARVLFSPVEAGVLKIVTDHIEALTSSDRVTCWFSY